MVVDRGVIPMYNSRGNKDILVMDKRRIKGKEPWIGAIGRRRENFYFLNEDRVVIRKRVRENLHKVVIQLKKSLL